MAPLEIAAAGRPTIAYRAGGAVETIIDGVTGVFFDRQEPSYLIEAIKRFEKTEWHTDLLRDHAKSFSIDVFHNSFREFLARIGCPVHDHSLLPFALPRASAMSSSILGDREKSIPAQAALPTS